MPGMFTFTVGAPPEKGLEVGRKVTDAGLEPPVTAPFAISCTFRELLCLRHQFDQTAPKALDFLRHGKSGRARTKFLLQAPPPQGVTLVRVRWPTIRSIPRTQPPVHQFRLRPSPGP